MLWIVPLPLSPSFPYRGWVLAAVLFFQPCFRFVVMASLPPSKHCDLIVLLTMICTTDSTGSTSNKWTSEENEVLELFEKADVLLSSSGWERAGQ